MNIFLKINKTMNKFFNRFFNNVEEEVKPFVIVRSCVGCVLPENAILIGQGDYKYNHNGSKETEHYYDYQIEEIFLDTFLEENAYILIKNHLLDVEKPKENEKDKNNPDKTSWRNEYGYEIKE